MTPAAASLDKKYGMLTVRSLRHDDRGDAIATCICDCGNQTTTHLRSIRGGHTLSCGCRKIASNKARATHGHRKRGQITGEYFTWASMKQRCLNPHSTDYSNYGGRGISICQQWTDSFQIFLSDMGRKPSPLHTLERIDNHGNYEPGNCRWATRGEQVSNTRRNRYHTGPDGQTRTIAEWARTVGLSPELVYGRLKTGWSVERALAEPVNAPGGQPRAYRIANKFRGTK